MIINPSKIDADQVRVQVRKREDEHDWAPSVWLETTEAEPGTRQAREAVESGAALVIAAGGDGTVRAVSDGLRGHAVPLGIVPAGTGNLLARNLGLPLNDTGKAIRIAFDDHSRKIDVGRLLLSRADGGVEEHSFLVMSGMGVDAQMILNTNPKLKKLVGWLAYVDAIARTVANPTSLNATFRAEGRPEREETINTLLIGNCGAIQGKLRLLPGARLDDGKLDVLMLRSLSFHDRTSLSRWLGWENSLMRRFNRFFRVSSRRKETDSFRYAQTPRLDVVLDHPEDFEVDGDSVGLVVAITAWADEASLTVRV